MDGRSLQALHELLNPDSQTEEDSNVCINILHFPVYILFVYCRN